MRESTKEVASLSLELGKETDAHVKWSKAGKRESSAVFQAAEMILKSWEQRFTCFRTGDCSGTQWVWGKVHSTNAGQMTRTNSHNAMIWALIKLMSLSSQSHVSTSLRAQRQTYLMATNFSNMHWNISTMVESYISLCYSRMFIVAL